LILRGTMHDRDLVVVFETSITKGLENSSDAFHAKRVKFCGAQRAYACAPVHMSALAHGPQDFFMPDGRDMIELAVDNSDDIRTLKRSAPNVALRCGWQKLSLKFGACLCDWQCRAEEYHRLHEFAFAISLARAPGT
jgi:hypothetical protein